MSYKTLIIIDNSSEMTTLNREIVKATLKYFISNYGSDNKVAIAVTGENAEYLTDYDDTVSTQIKTVESLNYTELNAPGTDVLMEVILDWKEGDLADRDILYVGCRETAINSDYTQEELLFEVNGKQYPVYTLACSQNENVSYIKSMNVLARISGGECISTEDAKADAEVERQLAEKIMDAMAEKRMLADELYENSSENKFEKGDYENADELSDEITGENDGIANQDIDVVNRETDNDSGNGQNLEQEDELTENTIYELVDDNITNNNTSLIMVLPFVCIAVLSLIIMGVSFIRRVRDRRDDERFGRKVEKNVNERRESRRMPFADADITDSLSSTDTVCLSYNESDDDSGTRLLYQTKEGVEITLEDRANPTKYYRIHVRDSIVIGRNDRLCDLAINYDDSISSKHCELYSRDNRLYCRDLGSSNGTMINQQKVYQELPVESGDILRIGRLSFFVQIIGDSYGV